VQYYALPDSLFSPSWVETFAQKDLDDSFYLHYENNYDEKHTGQKGVIAPINNFS